MPYNKCMWVPSSPAALPSLTYPPTPTCAQGVDISPFINNLPGGTSTTAFRSDDASGSTSQAANIQVGVLRGGGQGLVFGVHLYMKLWVSTAMLLSCSDAMCSLVPC